MKVLIVADVYPPEISSAANLMRELAEGLAKRGHQVTVATSYPRHYLNQEIQNKTFSEFVREGRVDVLRVKTLPLHKVNFIIRGISQLLLPILFSWKIRKFMKDQLEAVIVYSPPLPLGLVGRMVKKKYGARFLLNLQDLFPQNAIDLGILKLRPLIWFFEAMEKFIYKSADVITFHSEGGRRFLIEQKGVSPEKAFTLPNWIDFSPYEKFSEKISYRREFNLNDKFVFLFGGILGPAQGLEFLVEVARQVQDIPEILFLLVGDGMEKEKIKKLIEGYKLTNVLIKTFVPADKYPYLVRDFDVGLICLSSKNKTSFVPGKLLGYLAAGKPVLAFLNKESDGFEMIQRAGCGYASVTDDVSEAVALVRKLYAERKKISRLGRNSLAYARANFKLNACLRKIEKLLS